MSQLKGTYKEIFHIAAPLVIGNMAWAMIGITDQAFMGHYGSIEEAAIGPVSIFYSILFMIGFGYSRGIQLLIAKALGAKNKERVGLLFDNTLFVMLASSIVLSIFIYLLKDFFLHLLISDEAIIKACNDFLKYRILGIPASFVSCLFIAFYSGIGRTKLLSASVIIMSLVNILLNYLLVFGNHGFPRLGIEGSGIASTIAEWISLIILVLGLVLRKYIPAYHLLKSKINFVEIWKMTKTATPLMLQALIANAGWFVFFTFVEKMGQTELALSNILRQMILWIGIPIWALGSVTNTIIGNLDGQNATDSIKAAIKKINHYSSAITFFQCLILIVFYQQILNIFTMDVAVKSIAFIPIVIVSLALCIMSYSNIYFNALVSVSGTRYALYIETLSMLLYMGYVFFLFNLDDINISLAWTTEWIYWSVILLSSLWKLKQSKII